MRDRREQRTGTPEVVARFVDRVFGSVDEAGQQRIESELEPRTLDCGEVFYRQGDEPHGMAFVVRGRLEARATDRDGDERVLGEIGRGQPVGEFGVVSGRPRRATVRALRPTELLVLPQDRFEALQADAPGIVGPLLRAVAHRLDQIISDEHPYAAPETVAVVPLHPGAPALEAAEGIAAAAARYGSTHLLDADRVDAAHGSGMADHPLDGPETLRLNAWLDARDDAHATDLYLARPDASNWTRRCLSRADRLLLIARADADPAPGEVEALFADGGPVPNLGHRELVLYHPSDRRLPGGTGRWLEARDLERHHHVREGLADDLGRVARRMLGKAVGVVFSGGAARGMVHMGVLKALREAGVPVDAIGGASSGAGVGVLAAAGLDIETMIESTTDTWIRSGVFHDFSLPIVSILDSDKIRRGVLKWLGDIDMEDLWIDAWCVVTNLSRARREVFDRGPVWFAVLATCAIPGVLPPVYRDGDVLVDGGVLDNLPIDVMARRLTGSIIACDVGTPGDLVADPALRQTPPSSRILWRRLNPFLPAYEVPTLPTTLFATATCSSYLRQGEAEELTRILLVPDTRNLPGLSFSDPAPMVEAGYQAAAEAISELGVEALLGLETPA